MGRSAPCVGPQNNHTPSPRCAALAPWAVGRFYKGLIMRGPRGSAFERGGHNRSKTESPTCRGVGAIEPWPTTWRGACSELGHNTTTPSPNCVARVLRGRSANTARGESARAGRHDFQTRSLQPWCAARRSVTVLVRSSLAADGVGWSAPRAGPQHAKCVLCAARAHWAVGRYSTARNAHGPHVTGFERVDHDWLDPVPPTSRSVGVVETRLMACGGARPALGRQAFRRCICIGGGAAVCMTASGAGWWWGLAVAGVLREGGSSLPPHDQSTGLVLRAGRSDPPLQRAFCWGGVGGGASSRGAPSLCAISMALGFECKSFALVPAMCDSKMDYSIYESRHKPHPRRPRGGQCNPGVVYLVVSLNHRTNGGHSDVRRSTGPVRVIVS